MLLEHKLHATCLQSEVAVLSNGKIETEKVVEELLEEISRFEEGVSTLESEMHQVGSNGRLTGACNGFVLIRTLAFKLNVLLLYYIH